MTIDSSMAIMHLYYVVWNCSLTTQLYRLISLLGKNVLNSVYKCMIHQHLELHSHWSLLGTHSTINRNPLLKFLATPLIRILIMQILHTYLASYTLIGPNICIIYEVYSVMYNTGSLWPDIKKGVLYIVHIQFFNLKVMRDSLSLT